MAENKSKNKEELEELKVAINKVAHTLDDVIKNREVIKQALAIKEKYQLSYGDLKPSILREILWDYLTGCEYYDCYHTLLDVKNAFNITNEELRETAIERFCEELVKHPWWVGEIGNCERYKPLEESFNIQIVEEGAQKAYGICLVENPLAAVDIAWNHRLSKTKYRTALETAVEYFLQKKDHGVIYEKLPDILKRLKHSGGISNRLRSKLSCIKDPSSDVYKLLKEKQRVIVRVVNTCKTKTDRVAVNIFYGGGEAATCTNLLFSIDIGNKVVDYSINGREEANNFLEMCSKRYRLNGDELREAVRNQEMRGGDYISKFLIGKKIDVYLKRNKEIMSIEPHDPYVKQNIKI